MNKTALRTFATSARKELLKKVEARALKIGITRDSIKQADIESTDAIFIDGKQLSQLEKDQRNQLIGHIKENGFDQVMEEVAYTWFNRFTALRYMEVNNYLPTKVRVFSSTDINRAEPDMIKEALNLDLDLDKELIYDLKLNNKSEELFKYLIIVHCNDFNRFLPFMFEKLDHYTQILFPDGLLAPDSFVHQMTNIEMIPEEDWAEIEIIGWLYQYYNTEINELVYDGNMAKNRIPKELLPAATQLFTPDWAVKYMVENSLGRLWLEGHSNNALKESWKYYLDKMEVDTNGQPEAVITKHKQLNPEDIKVFDPCMGSGHILVYAFEILMQIYESHGYLQRDAAKLILQKNLYGLEIDDRAYQLACFSVMMKARKYNRRILSEDIELNLCPIVESNLITNFELKDIKIRLEDKDIDTANYLIAAYQNAKEYGSILNVKVMDYDSLQKSLIDIAQNEISDLFQYQLLNDINEIMPKLLKQARIMTQKYDIVITNPPYLGNSRMSTLLNDYVKNNYPNTKSDLSMVMYQKAIDSYSKQGGFISYITTTSWMYLKSFEEFRKKLLKTIEFSSLVDFGTELFDGKVGHNSIVSWVNRNSAAQENMIAIRLVDFCYSKRNQKKNEYFNLKNRYYPNQKDFNKIPGSPIAYSAPEQTINSFKDTIGNYFKAKAGISTGNNEKYIYFWYEVPFNKIYSTDNGEIKKDFYPLSKGGEFRKWYGNQYHVIKYNENSLKEMSKLKGFRHDGNKYFFSDLLSWSKISSSKISVRYYESTHVFDSAAPSISSNKVEYELLGFLNSKLADYFLEFISPTLNYPPGYIELLPYTPHINERIRLIVNKNLEISKEDWDDYELSRNFAVHPILKHCSNQKLISIANENWSKYKEEQVQLIRKYEEELNLIYIEFYGLEEVLSPTVTDEEITVKKADKNNDIKSLLSYFIGCFFGRYSLDEEGLIYGGGEFNQGRYKTFKADSDNILPILPGAYFENDIVSKFITFVQVTFGEETLTENLDFIADTLGKKKGETARETIRRYFLNDFFKNHVQTYKKRPIYWMFTSGKQKAFNCLVYMHRYDKTTLSRIRTDYLHEYQARLDGQKKDLLNVIEGDFSVKEINNAKKDLRDLDKKIVELKEYDELLHHMADMQIELDLDDGVIVNYTKFKGLVAKI